MKNSIRDLNWTDQAIYEWTQSGTKIKPAAAPEKISEAQILIGLKFPHDFTRKSCSNTLRLKKSSGVFNYL